MLHYIKDIVCMVSQHIYSRILQEKTLRKISPYTVGIKYSVSIQETIHTLACRGLQKVRAKGKRAELEVYTHMQMMTTSKLKYVIKI